ncbi:hypothetical protein ACQP00_20370 [Dactylosporangium sp. CS-047395]|uniref:hypothetical protein n=1 Tax=Dactylosporangium sp. CS-047395 TaxID=3239936 RepID=UPI003D925596
MTGSDPSAEADAAACRILALARWAGTSNRGRPDPAWPTWEQLAVALILDDVDHVTGMGYTVLHALEAIVDGMMVPPADVTGWLTDIRAQLPVSPP